MTAPPRVLILESEHPADLDLYAQAVARAFPEVEVRCAGSVPAALAEAGGANVLVAKAHAVPAELVAAMPRLEWIQALTTGVDHLLSLPIPAAVRITSARGIHGPQMSELAILMMLALQRDFPRMLENRRLGKWERWPQPLLQGKRVVIVGVGVIGEMLAIRCQALGMEVTGCSNGRTQAAGFARIEPREQLASLAAHADFVIVLTPYEAQTHHLINGAILAAMSRSAYLINLARGMVVDEAALIAGLRAGQIAGAALDVFEREPPAPDSPLWTLPNVIMTPHIGGLSSTYGQQLLPLVLDNLRAFQARAWHSMRNVVTRR